MNRPLSLLLLALACGLATPALADRDWDRGRDHRPDHGPDHRWHQRPHDDRREPPRPRMARPGCPPGLVWYGGECLRRDRFTHARPRIGQVLRPVDYRRIGDPRLYALEPDPRWSYYRDDRQIYRVDRHSQKVLAILQLVQALSR